jgi:hypothetical protein
MSPDEVEPRIEALWTAALDRRAREVAEGKVELIAADQVHAEAARFVRARAGE